MKVIISVDSPVQYKIKLSLFVILSWGNVSPNGSDVFLFLRDIKYKDHGRLAIENAGKLQVPALLLHGTGDRIIDYRGSEEFTDGSDLADLKLFEGGYHELHHDLCREEFLETIIIMTNPFCKIMNASTMNANSSMTCPEWNIHLSVTLVSLAIYISYFTIRKSRFVGKTLKKVIFSKNDFLIFQKLILKFSKSAHNFSRRNFRT